ncbi:unnamed protein product [Rotaria magnacalcarata]|uniref:NADH-ubiquinone oxidoreductase MWFE subunit n=1 Tax=Rotaria magnacalcarata TaxID=392030 RepID=A0A816E0I7_9BILA|nr:unnamed protein product [Rotaria magnacalcarata]CAF1646045.1 unnamed protein product [Rotaria magnacalcarata]CAF1932175.1 unnamed protein product [Rotaria magnacalcarata]CAF2117691.1 unnamed protein product [Rotaria magnacalcarata]CAF3937335.1 unnamed protein product [Rotaria magnacalcarata]
MVWFEIIPSLVLTAGPLLLIAAPTIYIGNWFFLNGKKYGPKNIMKDDRDYYMYLRDRRITGNEYYPRGVEAIDERPALVKLRNLWNM